MSSVTENLFLMPTSNLTSNDVLKAKEMAQWLIVVNKSTLYSVLIKDLSSVPSTHVTRVGTEGCRLCVCVCLGGGGDVVLQLTISPVLGESNNLF